MLRTGRTGVRFFFPQNLQRFAEAHPASYSCDTRDLSSAVNRPEREGNHLPTSSVQIKNEWSYTSSSPIHLHNQDKDKLRIQAALILVWIVLTGETLVRCSVNVERWQSLFEKLRSNLWLFSPQCACADLLVWQHEWNTSVASFSSNVVPGGVITRCSGVTGKFRQNLAIRLLP
jgi:hypothetical protein